MSQTIRPEADTARPIPARAIGPTTTWYWVAGVVAVMGLVAGIAVGVWGYLDALDEFDAFPRLAAPGVTEVVVDDPGSVVIYHVGAGAPDLADLQLSVTGPSGSVVAVQPYESELIFETGDGQARAVASFDAVGTGTYQVEAAGTVGGHLSVGRSWVWVGLPAVLGGLAIVGLSFLAAVVMWLTTIIRRSNAAARAARTSPT